MPLPPFNDLSENAGTLVEKYVADTSVILAISYLVVPMLDNIPSVRSYP